MSLIQVYVMLHQRLFFAAFEGMGVDCTHTQDQLLANSILEFDWIFRFWCVVIVANQHQPDSTHDKDAEKSPCNPLFI